MKQARFVAGTAFACALALVALGTPALASSNSPVAGWELSEADALVLTDFLESYDVEPATQESLLRKFRAGEPWDSFSPGASPVSVETRESATQSETIYTYADGSVAATGVEIPQPAPPNGGMAPMAGISGCTATSSGVTRIRTNCLVRHTNGPITMSFRANYRWSYYPDYYDFNVQSARIDLVEKQSVTVIGGTFSDRTLSIVRKTAGAQPALARAGAVVTVVAGAASFTIFLELFVPRGDQTLAYARATSF